MEPDAETLKYYQKREFFVPTSENELKIVLQTWHDLLELLTVKDSIATEGLAHILQHYDDHFQVIQEMFVSTEDFGLSVLVILDLHLQRFFEAVSELDDVTQASSRQRDFLYKHACEFLEGLEDRRPPSVVIPQCLRRTPTDHSTNNGSAAKKKKTSRETKPKAKRVTNAEPQQAWSVPEGKKYNDFFAEGGSNEYGWPKLVDARFEVPRKMCIQFQVKGACTEECTLAHVTRSKMSNKQETEVSARFKKVYGK